MIDKKYVCNMNGHSFAGGGILLYDNNGFWVVKEKIDSNRLFDESRYELTDFGGKYNYNDGDIYGCISRELAEESYHTIEIPSSILKNVPKIEKIMNSGKLQYLCLFVHIDSLNIDALNLKINRQEFLRAREETLKNNPDYTNLYQQTDLCYIPFSGLEFARNHFSYRLKTLLAPGSEWPLPGSEVD